MVTSVPSPSTLIEPPSSTISDGIRGIPRCASSGSPTAASLSQGGKRSPHALKRKCTPARSPAPSTTKIGPLSRIHESSIGSSIRSMSPESIRRATGPRRPG